MSWQFLAASPDHLLHCLTNCDLVHNTVVFKRRGHVNPSTLEQPDSSLSPIGPRCPWSAWIWCDCVERVAVHERVLEESSLANYSFWHAAVLFYPQPKRDKSFWYLLDGQGHSPKQICCAVNDEQYEVLARSVFDFRMIYKNQITKRRRTKACYSGSRRQRHGCAANLATFHAIILVIDLCWQAEH